MAVTFRSSGPPGTPTVISRENVVRDGLTDKEAIDFGGRGSRIDTGRGRQPGVSAIVDDSPPPGALSFNDFLARTGRSATNPFGNEGKMTKVFGLDPDKVDYTAQYADNPGGIAALNRLAYDRYLNPFAQTGMRGEPVGGDITTGTTRFGVEPGTLTRFGVAEAPPSRIPGGIQSLMEKIPGLLPGVGLAENFLAPKPAVIPNFLYERDVLGQPIGNMEAAQGATMTDILQNNTIMD